MIADDRVLFSLRRIPSAAPGCPVRKAPGQHKGVVGFRAGFDGSLQAESADRIARRGFRAEFTVGGKIVPKEHGRVPPPPFFPSPQRADFAVAGPGQAQGEASLKRVGILKT